MHPGQQQLIDILCLQASGENRWRGIGSAGDGAEGTYGGHFLGQATAAALCGTETPWHINSLHGYFLRAGTPAEPIEYTVERLRAGRSFVHLRVSALQQEKLLFEMTASLTSAGHELAFAATPPPEFTSLPAPQAVMSYGELMRSLDELPLPAEWALKDHGLDQRPVYAPWCERGVSPRGGICHWIKAREELPQDPALHAAMLAYQSDESVSDNVLIPFDLTWNSPGMAFVSLDHAMWFHRTVNLNEWLYVEQWPEQVAEERGLAHGRVWRSNGELVASFSQEALVRKLSDT